MTRSIPRGNRIAIQSFRRMLEPEVLLLLALPSRRNLVDWNADRARWLIRLPVPPDHPHDT